MKEKKELKNFEMFESTDLNKIIGGLTADEITAEEMRTKGGTHGTSSTTGHTYTDDADGSHTVWQ